MELVLRRLHDLQLIDSMKRDLSHRLQHIRSHMEMAYCAGVNLITMSHLRIVLTAQIRDLSTVIHWIPLNGRLTAECLLEIERDQEYLIQHYQQLSAFSVDPAGSSSSAAFAALDRLRSAYLNLIDSWGHVRARQAERAESHEARAL